MCGNMWRMQIGKAGYRAITQGDNGMQCKEAAVFGVLGASVTALLGPSMTLLPNIRSRTTWLSYWMPLNLITKYVSDTFISRDAVKTNLLALCRAQDYSEC